MPNARWLADLGSTPEAGSFLALAGSNIASIFVFKSTSKTLFFAMTSCRQQWWSWPRDSHLLGWRIHYWVIYWCIWTAWSQVLKGQTEWSQLSWQIHTYVTFTVSQSQLVCSSPRGCPFKISAIFPNFLTPPPCWQMSPFYGSPLKKTSANESPPWYILLVYLIRSRNLNSRLEEYCRNCWIDAK